MKWEETINEKNRKATTGIVTSEKEDMVIEATTKGRGNSNRRYMYKGDENKRNYHRGRDNREVATKEKDAWEER